MKEVILGLPELAMVVGTRAMAGAGIGVLLSDKMTPEQRRAVGWTLVLIGAITTIRSRSAFSAIAATKHFLVLASPAGVEPAAYRLGGDRSIH